MGMTGGKATYKAPELYECPKVDGFLSDAFSIGVMLYGLLARADPWKTTARGACKCSSYVRQHGLRKFFEKKRMPDNTHEPVGKYMSKSMVQLLEGLLAFTPDKRLTLGEKAFGHRKSVWNEEWVNGNS